MANVIEFKRSQAHHTPTPHSAMRPAQPMLSPYARACAIASDVSRAAGFVSDPELKRILLGAEEEALELAADLFIPPKRGA